MQRMARAHIFSNTIPQPDISVLTCGYCMVIVCYLIIDNGAYLITLTQEPGPLG